MTAPAAGGPYDLLIIGGGPAGYVGAIRAAQLGLKTALVEREKLGGTCVHVGCIPTKVLLHTAELLGDIRGAGEMGVQVGDVRLDYGPGRRRMDRVVTANFRGIEFLMRKNGIALFPGAGRFVTPTQVRVAASDGSEVSLEARHILVATGSRPRSLPGVVIDNDRVLDNAGALRLPEVPRSIAILGAGAVGAEFASAFAAFGATVTLIEMMPAILPLEDEELSGVVAKELGRRGRDRRAAAGPRRLRGGDRRRRGGRRSDRRRPGPDARAPRDLYHSPNRQRGPHGAAGPRAGTRRDRGAVPVHRQRPGQDP